MKPDHELAKMHAENFKDGCGRYMPSDGGNIYRAYLDAMARLDKATELLEEVDAYWGATRPALAERIRTFLAAERK